MCRARIGCEIELFNMFSHYFCLQNKYVLQFVNLNMKLKMSIAVLLDVMDLKYEIRADVLNASNSEPSKDAFFLIY